MSAITAVVTSVDPLLKTSETALAASGSEYGRGKLPEVVRPLEGRVNEGDCVTLSKRTLVTVVEVTAGPPPKGTNEIYTL